ncbi:NEDD8 ultimate buster 1 [Iris pallida]|uniref:NEDD8 ultimate buster 1 n=1 Tax=Iris pallida TaxID=29817 RepID=A0AAX6GR74_IRIPA|nr:NEDD8 ultimate buster 1 [Iris pallida]KAJ6831289.1 NEDD8 ultimate buster 1 [Iris pallida]
MASSRLRVGGAWNGVLELDLESFTVEMLREEVHRRSGAGPDRTISMICGGKLLKDSDGAETLSRLGIRSNTKVLATAVAADRGRAFDREASAEADRSAKLTRLRAAAAALAERHADGSLPVEDFNMELEDQSGQKVMLGSESDKKGVMTGLMLHASGKSLIEKQNYKDALDVLIMGEEAFALCDPKFIEMVDNVPMLQLDIVWCYFMLRDISCLSVAGERLAKARKGFERAHGKDTTRFRILHAGRHAELAIYLRLELLEGVVAYHSGKYEESLKALSSAQSKYVQLQVPDEALSLLMNMGYKEKSAKRALRMSGQDIQNAVDFLVEERANKTRRYQENIQRQQEILEQKKYGRTPQKKAVDIQRLNELVSIGFERDLAAEALRLNENDTQLALDLLTDPDKNNTLQASKLKHKIESRKAKALKFSADVEELVSMGHNRAAVEDALRTLERGEALRQLGQPLPRDGNPPPVGAAAEGTSGAVDTDVVSPENDRDDEMENEIAKELRQDAMADYDIEVSKEGDAIAEYLSLLESTANS